MTTTRALKDISLNELILPEAALNNIIENNEFEARLSDLASNAYVDNKLEERLVPYIQTETVSAISAELVALIDEKADADLSTDVDDCKSMSQQLTAALNGISLSVVNYEDYDPNIADPNTLYFVKAQQIPSSSTEETPSEETPQENENSSAEENPPAAS